MDIFHKLNKEQGKTIVLITHNNELAEETDRILTMKDGNIISQKINPKRTMDDIYRMTGRDPAEMKKGGEGK